jgi:hypothetical protein
MRNFFTVFETARHWSLLWSGCIQCTPYNSTSLISILILSSLLRLSSEWTKSRKIIPGNEHEGVSKTFRTGRLEREPQMVQLSATRCSCIAISWPSLVSFAAITLCVAFQREFIVVSVYFVIDSVRKLFDTPSCTDPSVETPTMDICTGRTIYCLTGS